MKIRLILLVTLMTLTVASCAPEVRILSDNLLQDTSLVTDDPCSAPCWRGITPGVTGWNEALDIIEADDTLDNLQTRAADDSDQIGAAWAQKDGDNCCQMFTQDGETVSLLVAQTAPLLTFDQVIEKYGEPAYMLGEEVSGDQALVSIYYPDVPMLVYLFVAGKGAEINGNSQVVGFAYTTVDLMELVIGTSDLYNYDGFGLFSSFVDENYDVTPSITLTPTPSN